MGHQTKSAALTSALLLEYFSVDSARLSRFEANPAVTLAEQGIFLREGVGVQFEQFMAALTVASAWEASHRGVDLSLSDETPGRFSAQLAYCSMDFALAGDGRVFFLELNDQPLGFPPRQFSGVHPEVCASTNEVVARMLVKEAAGSLIALLLPDRLAVSTIDHSMRNADLARLRGIDSISLVRLHDVNLLCRTITALGGDCLVFDRRGLEVNGEKLQTIAGRRVGAVFNLAACTPQSQVEYYNYNDPRARVLCLDKLALNRLIQDKISREFVPETHEYYDHPECREFLKARASENADVFVKPRFGTSSLAARRVQASTALGELPRKPREDVPLLVQENVELATTHHGGKEYRFDVTIHCAGGVPVSASANVAAAPLKLAEPGTPLQYLTNTGPLLTLDRCPELSDEVVLRILDMVSQIVVATEDRIASMPYKETLAISERYFLRNNLPTIDVPPASGE